RPAVEPARALVATGFSYEEGRRVRQAAIAARLLPQVRDIRRGGAAALDLAWLAAGPSAPFHEPGLQRRGRPAGRPVGGRGARAGGGGGGGWGGGAGRPGGCGGPTACPAACWPRRPGCSSRCCSSSRPLRTPSEATVRGVERTRIERDGLRGWPRKNTADAR